MLFEPLSGTVSNLGVTSWGKACKLLILDIDSGEDRLIAPNVDTVPTSAQRTYSYWNARKGVRTAWVWILLQQPQQRSRILVIGRLVM
ncbi:MAG: hypothetical protein WAM39_06110 [Bryobacteraceae bacterium]